MNAFTTSSARSERLRTTISVSGEDLAILLIA